MKALVTVVLAVIAGVGCTARGYAGDDVGTDEVAEEPRAAEPVGGSGRSSTDDRPDTDDPRWAIKTEGLPPTLFTSTVRGDDGALYAAGTFAGFLNVGRDTLKSRGEDDVVLVRLEPDGRVSWAKAIGSNAQERSPKVTFADGKVRILAETDGVVDCGSGDMNKWSSGMFFYCLYDTSGEALGGATFPTGAP